MKAKRNKIEIFWKVNIKMSQSSGENVLETFLDTLYLGPKDFLNKIFLNLNFFNPNFLEPKILYHNFVPQFFYPTRLGLKVFGH